MAAIPPKARKTATLTEALLKVQKDLPVIEADAANPFYSSSYSTLAGIIKTVTPILSANGMAVTQTFSFTDDGQTILRTTLRHVNGECVESAMVLTPAKPDMMSLGSAISYGRRYQLMSILNIATKRDDDDGVRASGKSVKGADDIPF